MCQPLSNGGLGIKNMRAMNDALLLKLAWGLITDNGSLWVQVLRDKYKAGKDLMPSINLKPNPSPIWCGICRIWLK